MSKNLASKATSVILAVVIAGILLGYVFPVGLGAYSGPDTAEMNSTVGQDVKITSDLYQNVNNIDDTTGEATVVLEDRDTGESETLTLQEGDTQSIGFSNGNIEVSADEVGTDYAVITYTHPTDYGWSGGESALFGVLGIFLVLVPLGVLAGYVMKVM